MSEVSCTSCVHATSNPGLGINVCSKFGLPISQASGERFPKLLAKDCDSYNARVDFLIPQGDEPRQVMIGTAQAIQMAALNESSKTDRVTHCSQCKYCVKSEDVQKAYGFPAPMCLPMGSLINPNKMAQAAASCIFGSEGAFWGTPEHVVTLLPKLEKALGKGSDIPAGVKSGKQSQNFHNSVDPRDWPTDREVTYDDERKGIRAWRKVSDPKGYGADIFMPVANWASMVDQRGERLVTEDPRTSWEGSKPHLYQDHGGLLYTAAALMMGGFTEAKALNKALTLRGEAGTGKTEFFNWLAYLMDVPFTRISITPATEVYHLEGKDTLVGGPNGETIMKFNMSRFAKAYAKPGVIVVDEWNAGQDEVQFFMRPLIDGNGQFVIESESVSVKRNPFCFVGFTMNPEDNPAYRGTRPLSEADWDRLLVRKLDLPTEEIERDIITSHVLDAGLEITEGQLDKLMDVAKALREKYRNGELPTPWRLRSQIKVASLLGMFTFEDSFRLAVADRLEDEVAELLMSEVRAIVG